MELKTLVYKIVPVFRTFPQKFSLEVVLYWVLNYNILFPKCWDHVYLPP